MDQQKIDMFIATHAKKFNPFHLNQIQNALRNADENRFQMALAADYKDPSNMLIVSLLVGYLGVDRFMLGQTGLGVAKLLTVGGCGIWTIIDWFKIQDMSKNYNFSLLMQVLG